MPIVSLTATSKTPRSATRAATSATLLRRHRAFERTAERRRQVAAHAQPAGERAIADRLVGRERLVDALVDVLAAERFGRRREDRDLGDAGGDRALEAGEVRHERRVARAAARA